MPQVRTGPVRVSGYALKLRRAVNATLRDYYSKGELNSKEVNNVVSEVNRSIYSVLIEKFEVPKDAVVNVVLEYEVEDGRFKVKDIVVDVYDRDDILSKNVTEEVRRIIKSE